MYHQFKNLTLQKAQFGLFFMYNAVLTIYSKNAVQYGLFAYVYLAFFQFFFIFEKSKKTRLCILICFWNNFFPKEKICF